MAHVERIRLYPIKALNAEEVESAPVTDVGTLAGDREYAFCDPDAETFESRIDMRDLAYNGKQTDRVHDVRTEFDFETGELTVRPTGDEVRRFDLASESEAASDWFGDFIGETVTLRHNAPPAFVDRPEMGPSVISTATLEEVASWFDGMSVEGARRRLRANVEIGGVPAFWEDRFVGEGAPAFEAGGVRFEGAEACARCVVPSRDPETGDPLPEFRERFVERREATFPEWADRDAFDHLYTLMLISRIPEESRGETLSVGDEVEILEPAR